PGHAGPTVKILDIGLGRALFDEDAPVGENQLTAPGEILGKPEYMAPEQARDAHTSDIRGDIYSLGCILYHAVGGQPPLVDTNVVGGRVGHAKETPRPLRQFEPSVPSDLEDVVSKMMAKSPAQRYATPAAAARALEPLLNARGRPRPPAHGPFDSQAAGRA